MPTTVEVSVKINDPHSVMLQGIHAHICRWLDTADTHRDNAKPFSVTPLLRSESALQTFHLNLLDDSLVDRLSASVGNESDSPLRFGRSIAYLPPNPLRVIRHLSYDSLADLGATSQHMVWDVDVVTPMVTRSHDRDLVFPLPGSVLKSLHRQWSAWSPGGLIVPREFLALPQLHALEFDGSSTSVTVRNRRRVGFLGSVRFGLDPSESEAARSAVSCLMEFARFSGVGSMTTFGLGVVEVAGGPRM